MSKTKAALVEEGKKYGIKNGADMAYGQLEREVRALKSQATPGQKRKAANKSVVARPKSKSQQRREAIITRAVDKKKAVAEKAQQEEASRIDSKKQVTEGTATAQDHIQRVNTQRELRPGRVQLRRGLVRCYYVIKAPNGEILSTSQKYYSEYNAERAALKIARDLGLVFGGWRSV